MVEVKLTIEVQVPYGFTSQDIYETVKKALEDSRNLGGVKIWGYQDNIDNAPNSHEIRPSCPNQCNCELSDGLTKNEAPIKRGEIYDIDDWIPVNKFKPYNSQKIWILFLDRSVPGIFYNDEQVIDFYYVNETLKTESSIYGITHWKPRND